MSGCFTRTREAHSPFTIVQPPNASRSPRLCGGAALDSRCSAALIPGKMVVEFQPLSVNKGLAIAAFLRRTPFPRASPGFYRR